jgi:tRNA modification GTPase
MKTHLDDTIVALSSPFGQGGIGIVRMTGPDVLPILGKVFRPRKSVASFESHRLNLGFLFDPASGRDVDEVFAVYMEQPRTYTREHMVEVYAHGGLASQRSILSIMVEAGARMAEPGEFTRRAFLNGRIDLAQAESVLDIIESESAEELASALAHTKGELSERISRVKADMRSLLADVEAQMDFSEEDIETETHAWSGRLETMASSLFSLAESFYQGRAIRQGLDVLIVGKANVGKSSILNALAQKDRAIVTPIPGTTRDLLDDVVSIYGVKFRITDTAGLRQPSDPVEEAGIDRVRRRIPDADICLWVLDGSRPYDGDDDLAYIHLEGKKTVAVLNKSDLPRRMDEKFVLAKGLDPVNLSALTGSGLDDLKMTLYKVFEEHGYRDSGLLITNERHRGALARTGEALDRARACLSGNQPLEFLSFEIRDALSCLGEITGETCPEEILDDIFSRFCIGK